MKTFNLIKTRDGENRGVVVSQFIGYSENDPQMLSEVANYLRTWVDAYTSLSDEELGKIVNGFNGGLHYDVWNFKLEEEESETD